MHISIEDRSLQINSICEKENRAPTALKGPEGVPRIFPLDLIVVLLSVMEHTPGHRRAQQVSQIRCFSSALSIRSAAGGPALQFV
ncbi:hypothetical protein DBV39_06630 [Orrella marina]|uniref:Uncharacterized protein n=1 Tax=Orrella marina TaxID=2163011 RepID=A0A2R4XI12_9BURK|nr:hypothetical protein DBV39_06630 [Orrella marina]